jgi:tetratricopeptide (TPR) repeat protein
MIRPNGIREDRLVCLLSICLALVTLAVYWPVRHFDFINLDDTLYVYESNMVKKGLTWPGFLWAFHSIDGGNWNPLVWLSHMVDCQLYGLKPGGHHVTNVIFHVLNVWLLFWCLRRMTGAIWPSAFVAAIFAWHPMHVESVAWVSERKDVLSTFFWLASTWAYAGFAKATGRKRISLYGLALLLFALGLLCKSMLVTLPFVFLLLDYWPLCRKETFGKLVLEKNPFALLSLGAAAAAIWSQQCVGALDEKRPVWLCLQNAVVSYFVYVEKFFCPTGMAVFYPFPKSIPTWQVVGSALFIVGVTGGIVSASRQRRYLGAGWFWFVGTLVPIIGIVQVGMQAQADRYTYVPYIGLAIMMAWGLAELVQRQPTCRSAVYAAVAFILAASVAAASAQVGFWRNSKTVYERALNVTTGNYIAHSNLGLMYFDQGDLASAAEHDEAVIKIMPSAAKPYNNLGNVYAMQSNLDRAIPLFQHAAELEPKLAPAHYNLGTAYLRQGKTALAVPELETALTLRPDDLGTQSRLIDALLQSSNFVEAVKYAEKFANADPTDAHARFNLGWVHEQARQPVEALDSYREAVRLAPNTPECLNAYAWTLATSPRADLRDGAQAVQIARRACDLTRMKNAQMLDTLAAAYAEAGRFDEAVKTTEQMRDIATSAGDTNSIAMAARRLELYRAKKPYHDEPAATP